jgi:hypothetical protein
MQSTKRPFLYGYVILSLTTSAVSGWSVIRGTHDKTAGLVCMRISALGPQAAVISQGYNLGIAAICAMFVRVGCAGWECARGGKLGHRRVCGSSVSHITMGGHNGLETGGRKWYKTEQAWSYTIHCVLLHQSLLTSSTRPSLYTSNILKLPPNYSFTL